MRDKFLLFQTMAQIVIAQLPKAAEYSLDDLIAHVSASGVSLPEDTTRVSSVAVWRMVASVACKRGLLAKSSNRRRVFQTGRWRPKTLYLRTDVTHVIAPSQILMEAHDTLLTIQAELQQGDRPDDKAQATNG